MAVAIREGESATGFIDDWDMELFGELHPVWTDRHLLSDSLMDVDHLVTVFDNILRNGASLSVPSLNVVPRKAS